MNKWRIEFYRSRKFSPVSWWVHEARAGEGVEWRHSETYDPPFPNKVALKGFPYLVVSIGNFELEFASSYEVKHCIDVLSQKNLPSTKNMVCQSSTTYKGYNHWLASYPAYLKSWKLRQKTVGLLSQALKSVRSNGVSF